MLCPLKDFDCIYYDEDYGTCLLDDPITECDDCYAAVGDKEEDE